MFEKIKESTYGSYGKPPEYLMTCPSCRKSETVESVCVGATYMCSSCGNEFILKQNEIVVLL